MNSNLVTGGTGLLGSQLVLRLLLRGQSVRAGFRTQAHQANTLESFRYYAPGRAELLFKKIQWFRLDLHDQDNLRSALQGISTVYHTAAKVSFDSWDRAEMMQTNVEGTRQLLYACEGLPLDSFVHFSSIAVLDGPNQEGRLDADSFYNAKLPHSEYAISKHFSEMEVWRAQAEGLPAVILNPGIILSAGFTEQSSGALIPRMIRQPFTFPGSTGLVDVRDVAEIAIRLAEKKVVGKRFPLVAETLPFAEIDRVVKSVGSHEPAPVLSPKLLKTAPYLSSLLGWAIPVLRMADRASIEAILGTTPVDSSAVVQELGGYSFYPILQSLKDYTTYYYDESRSPVSL